MSTGSPIVPIRIPAELLATLDAEVSRSATTRSAEPWTRSSFIIAALREKIAHQQRSRNRKRKG